MPEIKPDMTEQEWMEICIPYLIKKEGKTQKEAQGQCYGMWEQHQKNKKGGETRTRKKRYLNAAFVTTEHGHVKNLKATKEGRNPMVLVVGDRFMNGEFVPAEELEKVYTQWNGTYHNLNHGRNFDGRVMIQEIVGVHTDATYDKDTKAVQLGIIEGEVTEKYNTWKGFISLNQKANKPTNVSMELYADEKKVKYKDIKDLVSMDDKFVAKNMFKDDDEVTYLYDLEPAGGATVDIGAGGDDCSFIGKNEDDTDTDTNNAGFTITINQEEEDYKNYLKKRIIQLGGKRTTWVKNNKNPL